MAGDLLERDQFLAALNEELRRAVEGHGHVVLVSGEAGIGKTALVERFVAQAPTGTRALWGACEAFFTPRPLGPLYDIAQQTQGQFRTLLDGEPNRPALFSAVLDELIQHATPTLVIIEDIHWADEATLDLLKYLARRITQAAALLVLTYRDDEIVKSHPLRLVLGDLPARNVTRLHLPPLSEAAVKALARKAADSGEDFYRATGGNPFFVTEALASGAPGVPTSVSDAVLTRVARRSSAARRLLEAVAIAPNQIESWLVWAISDGGIALEECLSTGILLLDGDVIKFRHELARQAVESAVSPPQRQALHAQVLTALLERGKTHTTGQPSLARLTHHAAAAGDATLVLQFAPDAARQASSQGAHREAVAHYQTALRYPDQMTPEQRADLLEDLTQELSLAGRHADALHPCEEALAIRRALGHTERIGHNLRRLSRLSWFLGSAVEAERFGLAAVELLETLPPGRELAMAFANLSNLRMVESDIADTKVWSERAMRLAERIGDTETLSYALNNLGTARLEECDDAGWEQLERSLAIALEHGHEEHVARAYANLSGNQIGRRDYVQAAKLIENGIAFCAERDLGSWANYLVGQRSSLRLALGDWDGAEEDAAAILSVPWEITRRRTPALLVLGQVRTRRGDPGAGATLDEARSLASAAGVLRTGVFDSFVAIAAAQAEWRWMQGDLTRCIEEADAGLQESLKRDNPWYRGDVAIWLWRCGQLHEPPANTFPAYTFQIAGDWRAAGAAWEQIGCPYERALALLDGDETAQREALAIFERLGAAPAAEIARRRLREAGVRSLPRGPQRATRANPYSLTPRQLEILLLLAEGLHNSEIAERLSTTPKTVEHHVSAILAKLGARSRAEAIRLAFESGLINQGATTPSLN
jgi:DNA-binding CsgD family transcriptional regulator